MRKEKKKKKLLLELEPEEETETGWDRVLSGSEAEVAWAETGLAQVTESRAIGRPPESSLWGLYALYLT